MQESHDDGGNVCSLPPADLHDRVTLIRTEILPLARRTQALPNGRAWEFARDAALQSKLGALVSFERECCGGLDWNLDVEAETLRLRVEGIAPDSDFFAPLVGDAEVGNGAGARKALGAGAGGILAGLAAMVVCELPLLLGVIGLGAAPFLDAFAAAALALGAGLLGWGLWRRHTLATRNAAA